MPQSSSNSGRLWIWAVVFLLVVAGASYFALPTSRDHVTVRTARVERGDLAKNVATNGRVEPLVDYQPHSAIPSTVKQLSVHLGETVVRGQQLLQLDSADAQLRVANAKNTVQLTGQDLRNMAQGGTNDELLGEHADMVNAGSELKDATANLSSWKTLQAQGAASANEVAAAQQRLANAQARMSQLQTRARSRFGTGDFANGQSQQMRAKEELSAAEDNLAGLDLRSPIAGTVYALPIARYDYINPGEPLLSIADLSKLQVRAFFDEPDIGNLKAGEPVRIVWDAKPDSAWHGHVTQAPTTVANVGSRNVGECLISVDDANGDLLPNTNVTVTVTTLQRDNVLSLPREALHTQGAYNFVYRILNDKLVQTPVRVGIATLTSFEVTGGLKQGDLVALGATTDTDLQNGLPVRTLQP